MGKRDGIRKLGPRRWRATAWLRGTDGRRKKRTKTFETKTEARAWRQAMLGRKRVAPVTTMRGLSQYILSQKKDRKTYRDVVRYWTEIVNYFGPGCDIKDLDEGQVERFRDDLSLRPKRGTHRGRLSNRSKDHLLLELRSAFRLAHRRGWVERVPEIRLFGGYNVRELPITLKDFKRTVDAMTIRDQAIAWTLFFTGNRIGAVLRMKRDQVRDRITLRSDKSGKPVSIPVPAMLRRLFAKLPPHIEGWMFASRRGGQLKSWVKPLRTAIAVARTPAFTAHHIRHLAASIMLSRTGGDEDLVARTLGMARQTLRKHYAHYDGRADQYVADIAAEVER